MAKSSLRAAAEERQNPRVTVSLSKTLSILITACLLHHFCPKEQQPSSVYLSPLLAYCWPI